MIFAPLQLCKKLAEMGCVSESDFWYADTRKSWKDYNCPPIDQYADPVFVPFYGLKDGDPELELIHGKENAVSASSNYNKSEPLTAFCFEDFTGCTPQARENARIVLLGDEHPLHSMRLECPVCGNVDGAYLEAVDCCRHELIDYADGPWWEFLEKNMIKKGETMEIKEHRPYRIGQSYLIRTVTHHYIGILKWIGDKELVISSASWIADDGRYYNALKDGTLNEVEPIIGDAIIGRGSIIDCVEWRHACPEIQK